VLLAVAMAFRPALPGGEVPTASVQARVFVMIDTSQSVAAEDWGTEPRLAGMQEDVVEIARSFAGADISVISFDSQASLRVPLTDDGSAVIEMVRALRPEIAQQSRGTSVAAAHDVLRTELERSAAADPASPAIVFYLGDGEHTAEDEPQSFGDLAGQIDRGLVLGYGTEQGGRMRVSSFDAAQQRQYLQDPAGGDAISRIDEGRLRGIADQLGITYLHRAPGLPIDDALGPMAALDGAADLDRTEEARLEIAWVFGIPIALLLAWEGFSLARSLRTTRGILPREAKR
jgi:Ca-activated chloride channel homolog